MTTLGIDTDAVRSLAHAFARRRLALENSEAALWAALGAVDLFDSVVWRLQDRGNAWDRAAERLREAAADADAIGLDLATLGPDRVENVRLTMILSRGLPDDRSDLGGTLQFAERSPFHLGSSGAPAGRDAVAWSLAATADRNLISDDEFLVIDHGAQRFTLILPGVTDLSLPDLGLSDRHRTARDLDRGALGSFGNHDIRPNSYADLVATAVLTELPPAAQLCIVGHSYGSDVAADLAHDERFNDPDGVRITHLVLTAYDSEEAVADLPARLPTLVLRNVFDVPVLVEDTASTPFEPFTGIALPRERTQVEGAHVRHQFLGGLSGAGHHPDHYIEAVRSADHAAIEAFFASVAADGYADDGQTWAVDISVPS